VIQHEFGISQSRPSRSTYTCSVSMASRGRAAGARRLYAVDASALQQVDQRLQPYRRFWNYYSTAFHLNPEMRPAIERGSAAMAALLDAEADS
jgi:hypothetical protein